MEPYDPGCNPEELGGVGEGVRSSDGAVPLTAATSDQRSQVSLSLPLPQGRGVIRPMPNNLPDRTKPLHNCRRKVLSISYETTYACCADTSPGAD